MRTSFVMASAPMLASSSLKTGKKINEEIVTQCVTKWKSQNKT